MSMVNVDALVDNYAKLLARKYDLTEQQDAFTHQFLREKSRQFLDRHEEELRGLIDRMFEARSTGEMDQQELIAWGKQVLPIYDEAKQLIITGNEEWRQILTEDQRRIHDEDLKLMTQSFQTTDDQLQRIVTGQMTVQEFTHAGGTATRKPPAVNPQPETAAPPNPPAPPPTTVGTPPTPPPTMPNKPIQPGPKVATGPVVEPTPNTPGHTAPTTGGSHRSSRVPGAKTAPEGSAKDFEGQWEAYTREFIARFKLTDEQATKAESILKECQDQGKRFMAAHKDDIEKLDKKAAALRESKDKDRAKQEVALNQERTKLTEQITQIFETKLKPRLDKLPTRAQRQAAEAEAKKGPAKPGATPAGPNKRMEGPANKPPTPPVNPPVPPPANPPVQPPPENMPPDQPPPSEPDE